ncbi:hypothetical protein WR25_25427 [Diploscapter pachys]|uniref:Carbonic anhydrase n=1 Tax=Diploscapter pachys TaxID=2018661 RepID=A0A2A2JGU9_9BILA|nr:hypothetical protein WR25_25427 [Diploscapter pachys]
MMPGLNKILEGVIRFRQTVRKDLVKQFERIRDNPNPTAVFFTCMDSRMLPARVTQSQVGDMFVVRNSGNMIPHARNYGSAGYEVSVTTEPAALELAVKRGGINHVIVCGHSDCKASLILIFFYRILKILKNFLIMINRLFVKEISHFSETLLAFCVKQQDFKFSEGESSKFQAINTLYNLHKCPKAFDPESPMDHWLRRHGFASIQKLEARLADTNAPPLQFISSNPLFSFTAIIDPLNEWGVEDKLSQINTLQQLENVTSHGFLKEFLESGKVHLHAMWFDVYTGEMYMFSKKKAQFVLVDENSVDELEKEASGKENGFSQENANFSLCETTEFSGICTRKEEAILQVDVMSETEGTNKSYKITLDGKVLKTQAGKPLQIECEPLALAIAEEWSSQEEHILMGHMRLTGLAFTAQDNPLHETNESIASKVIEYLDGDTILYWTNENEKLEKYQEKAWRPLIDNANKEWGTTIKPSTNIFDSCVTDSDREIVMKWLLSHNFWALTGMQYAAESVKSVLLPFNVLNYKISAVEAIEAAALEQRVQRETWGTVEWAHNIDEEEQLSRLSAACLFVYLNSNTHIRSKTE